MLWPIILPQTTLPSWTQYYNYLNDISIIITTSTVKTIIVENIADICHCQINKMKTTKQRYN